jgi:fatty-acyl-CoA synthase
LDYLSKDLPKYAIPLFLRFKSDLSITSTFKLKKKDLRKQNFNPNDMEDVFYFLEPQKNQYIKLDNETYQDILDQKFKL